MASIKISGLPEPRVQNKAFTYSDLHLDLQKKYLIKNNFQQYPEINDLILDYDLNAIKNSIRNIFNTAPGEKVLNPNFGLDLKQFLFEPLSELRAMDIAGLIRSKLNLFEPRILLNDVNVYPMYDTSEYNIEISFSLPELNTPAITMSGALNSIGYTNY
jgi:phage baseplate assembly protein W